MIDGRYAPAHALTFAGQDATLAGDIMTRDIVSVLPEMTVHQIAVLLGQWHISAVPVQDSGLLVGVVGEAELNHFQELGTVITLAEAAKAPGRRAADIMSAKVATVWEETPLVEIAKTFLTEHIKRVMVMRGAKLVGIVARADIVRARAARPAGASRPVSGEDDMIRYKVIETLLDIPGTSPWSTSVKVSNGIVDLGGAVEDEAAREPSRVAIEKLPKVVEVRDCRAALQPY